MKYDENLIQFAVQRIRESLLTIIAGAILGAIMFFGATL